jgi:hypothetical protein
VRPYQSTGTGQTCCAGAEVGRQQSSRRTAGVGQVRESRPGSQHGSAARRNTCVFHMRMWEACCWHRIQQAHAQQQGTHSPFGVSTAGMSPRPPSAGGPYSRLLRRAAPRCLFHRTCTSNKQQQQPATTQRNASCKNICRSYFGAYLTALFPLPKNYWAVTAAHTRKPPQPRRPSCAPLSAPSPPLPA